MFNGVLKISCELKWLAFEMLPLLFKYNNSSLNFNSICINSRYFYLKDNDSPLNLSSCPYYKKITFESTIT